MEQRATRDITNSLRTEYFKYLDTDQINMPGCAAVGCSNSAEKGFIMKVFPRDPKRRKEWADRLNRDKWSPTNWSKLCEVHFSPEMWEKVREDGSKKLKHNALPTIFNAEKSVLEITVPPKNEPPSPPFSKTETSKPTETNSPFAGTASSETEPAASNINESIPKSSEVMRSDGESLDDSEFLNNLIIDPNESSNLVCRVCLKTNANTISLLHLNPDDAGIVNTIFQDILGETIEQMLKMPQPQRICDSCLYYLGHAFNFKKTYEKTLGILENSLSENNGKDKYHNRKSCRICLNPDAKLPFALELTLDDESTLDVLEVFQDLTGETSEQIYDSTTPQRICDKCPDSLVYAYQFKNALEKSTRILNDSLLNTDTISEPTDRALEDLEKKLYNEEFSETEDKLTKKEIEIDAVENETLDEYNEQLSETEENSTNKEIKNELHKIGGKQIKLHSCPICFKKFSALELKQHCKSHDSLKSYFEMAPVFEKKLRFYAKPKNNICLFYRDPVLHTCPFCFDTFNGKDFRNHIKTHKIDGKFQCKVCDRKFLGRNHLKRHQLSHRKECPFECEVCGKGFFLKKNFDFHQFHHTTPLELPFQCKRCSKSFSNPEHLKRHNFTHEKSMTYKKYYPNKQNFLPCKQCQQKFKTQEELEKHECNMICAKCLKPFANKRTLANHGCGVERLQFVCACGKEFKTYVACVQHSCKKKRQYLCSICGKNVSNLRQHLKIHYPVKDDFHSCDACGKKFKYRESVWRHKIAEHRPPATFTCQYCQKSFKTKIYMKNHEKEHTRKKEHICQICGESFLYKVYLTRHQKKPNVHKRITAELNGNILVVLSDSEYV